MANNYEIRGSFKIDLESNNHYAADTVSGEISMSADTKFGFDWWDKQTEVTIDVQMSIETPAAWTSILVATIDHIHFHPTTLTLRFDGRDLTSRFIDTKTQETFANQTSSAIAQTLAARHGMTAQVTPTKTLVGAYYAAEHDKITMGSLSKQTTEWDLLTYLAQEEGFEVWVTGKVLYFMEAPKQTKPPFKVAYVAPFTTGASPVLNVSSLTLERSLALAKDIQVTVKSTNLTNGAAYTRVVKGTGAKTPGAKTEPVQNYVFKKPGLTPDQALKYAQQKLLELSAHERIANITMPGELTINARDKVEITGTKTGFDTTYFIDHITRSMDFEQGFTQHIRCKNTPTKSQTTVL